MYKARAVAPSPALSANDLGRAWDGRWVLSGVNLTLGAGGGLLVAGRNGAGKSTLLKLLATVWAPSRGSLSVAGFDPAADRDEVRRRVAYFGHEDGLWNDLGAADHIRTWARLLGADPQVGSRLAAFDLPAGEAPVRTFSAGMRRRLALLAIAMREPTVLLLDEPYSHLDAAGFALLDRMIDEHMGRGGVVVAVSHHLERLSNRIREGLLLDGGRPRWVGPAQQLSAQLAGTA